jgi:hypothetical protein
VVAFQAIKRGVVDGGAVLAQVSGEESEHGRAADGTRGGDGVFGFPDVGCSGHGSEELVGFFAAGGFLGVVDGVETESDFASAGEMWLDVQNRITAAADRNP